MAKQITVTESKWGPSYLLNPENGDMCCLGQAAEQCGVSREELSGRTMMSATELGLDDRTEKLELPYALANEFRQLTEFDLSSNAKGTITQIKSFIGYANDAYHRATDKRKRTALKAWLVGAFAACGYDLEFAP